MNTDQISIHLQEIVDELVAACAIKPFQIKEISSLINKASGLYQLTIYNYARLILDGKANKKESIAQLKRKIAEREKELQGETNPSKGSKYYDNILAEFRYNYKLCNGDFNKAVDQTVEMMDCSSEDVHTAIEVQGRGLLLDYQEI